MTDLTPVRLSPDGTQLILVSERGVEFRVLADERLRSVLRGDQTRIAQVVKKMDSTLSPRDIQNRIRAGESAEELASSVGAELSRVMIYASPVLAERAHIAQASQKASLRRGAAEGSLAARTLGEAVRIRLSDLGVPEEHVEWDAWRRPDGRWTVVADFATAGQPRRAIFTHDTAGRFASADNDEARVLTGEMSDESEVTGPVEPVGRRLSSVPNGQDELPLGDDAIELVRSGGGFETPLRGSSTTPVVEETASSEMVDEDEVLLETAEAPEHAETPAPKKSRSSMPSWDEIMFGGKPE